MELFFFSLDFGSLFSNKHPSTSVYQLDNAVTTAP